MFELREGDESGEEQVQETVRELDHGAISRPWAQPQAKNATVESVDIAPYHSRAWIIAVASSDPETIRKGRMAGDRQHGGKY